MIKIPVLSSRLRGQWACWLALALAFQLSVRADQTIYDDELESGWQNWGWATLNYANTAPVHSGSDSISVTFAGTWQGIQLYQVPTRIRCSLPTSASGWTVAVPAADKH